MKKIIIIAIFLIVKNISAQQISDGFSPIINDFTTALKSGVYTGHIAIGKVPDVTSDWNHLFVIRHNNQTNNYQLQIGSSYSANDRLFFRKIGVNSLSSLNPSWIELATRGANVFNGNQTINGNLDFFNYTNKIVGFGDPNNYYIGYFPVTGSAGLDIHFYGGIRFGDATSNSVMQIVNGKVGIGITNPTNKLDVNGTIHSKEVKVDMNGWSDFVFKKEYSLPTLEEVEKHIAEKGHLENIPSEEDVLKNGISLGEMNSKLLQKIEELTLYIIEQNKRIELQNERIFSLEQKITTK